MVLAWRPPRPWGGGWGKSGTPTPPDPRQRQRLLVQKMGVPRANSPPSFPPLKAADKSLPGELASQMQKPLWSAWPP